MDCARGRRALAFFAIALYNRLIGLRNQTLNGWRQIDVQLKRRHDLIPNLVNTVRGAMEFERDTLTQVMEARARAVSATGPADSARKEGELSQALGRLFAVAENYPALKREREREDAAGGADVDGEQGGLRAAVLQRHRHQVQHAQQTFPPTCLRRCSASRRPNSSRSPMPAERQVPAVDLSHEEVGLAEISSSSRRPIGGERGPSWRCSSRSCCFLGYGFDRVLSRGAATFAFPIGSAGGARRRQRLGVVQLLRRRSRGAALDGRDSDRSARCPAAAPKTTS